MTKEYLELLKYMAEHNRVGFPFSACIKFRDGYYFSTNTVTSCHNPIEHAEINVIQLVCKKFKLTQLEDAILYSSGEPCPMCLCACAWAGIKTIYYVNSYKVANEQGYKYDADAQKTNELLQLDLTIKQINEETSDDE